MVGALVGSLLAVVHLPPATAAGETFTWDGGGADDAWTTAANWGQPPSKGNEHPHDAQRHAAPIDEPIGHAR